MVLVHVRYASAHGSTREIAHRIGARLEARGHRTEVRDLDGGPGGPGPPPGAALVLGSAVHDGAWLPDAEAFVRGRAEELRARPVWMFSVGMTAALPGPLRALAERAEQPRVAALVELVRPREHRRFSGVIRPGHLSRRGAVLFRLAGCRYGDHRDWAAVEAWADGIGRELDAPPGRAG